MGAIFRSISQLALLIALNCDLANRSIKIEVKPGLTVTNPSRCALRFIVAGFPRDETL